MTGTTIRLPKDLKQRVAAAAERAGTTAHSFILSAIAEKAEQADRQAEFHGVAEQRFAAIVASAHIREIIDAFSVLETSPLIGRPAAGDLRELIIGKRTRGYVALYRCVATLDSVFVLALRRQREAGCSHG